MADIYKFPNGGFDVTVCKKQDILDCIDENILDKEIALDIVKQCEIDAADFIKKGCWTGIPFIGSIRVPKITQMTNDPVQQALIEDAKANLNHEQYVVFRKQLNVDNAIRVKQERYYKYIVSMTMSRNKKLFNKICKTKGEVFARLLFYANGHITAVDNEYVIFDNDEL